MILNSTVVAISVQELCLLMRHQDVESVDMIVKHLTDVLLLIKVIATVLGVKSLDAAVDTWLQSIIMPWECINQLRFWEEW